MQKELNETKFLSLGFIIKCELVSFQRRNFKSRKKENYPAEEFQSLKETF